MTKKIGPLETEWQRFVLMSNLEGAPAEDVKYLRDIFLTGAMAATDVLSRVLRTGTDTISDELDAFRTEIRKRAAKERNSH